MFNHLPENRSRSSELEKLVLDSHFNKELNQLAVAIIDLKNPTLQIFGINLDLFMYPASVYKVFIGAEVLRQAEAGVRLLNEEVVVQSPNDVDKDARLFPDTRPLLKTGDRVTVDYLLDLMLTRSDNTASNCLIDLVGRENISKNIIDAYGWQGSEVTRKFLDRVREERQYRYNESTKSCVRHVAEFFYLVHGLGKLVGTILTKGWAFIRHMHDAGVVEGKNSKYVVVVFTLSKQLNPRKYFQMDRLGKVIFEYMENGKEN